MQNPTELISMVEEYLDEMIEAERANDYQAWIARFDKEDLEGFNQEIFEGDIQEMNEELGAYKSREFLTPLRSIAKSNESENHKFSWKGVYEKVDVIMIVGIHKKDGDWYVNQYTINH